MLAEAHLTPFWSPAHAMGTRRKRIQRFFHPATEDSSAPSRSTNWPFLHLLSQELVQTFRISHRYLKQNFFPKQIEDVSRAVSGQHSGGSRASAH
jgi:hypothetical protein